MKTEDVFTIKMLMLSKKAHIVKELYAKEDKEFAYTMDTTLTNLIELVFKDINIQSERGE